MKRLLISLVVLLCTFATRAQTQDLVTFLLNAPWTLTPREVLLNYEGLEDYPLLEALYPISGELNSKMSTYIDSEGGATVLGGFNFGEFDAYTVLLSKNYDSRFDAMFSFISPESTAGVPAEIVLMGLYSQMTEQLGDPAKENSEVEEIEEGLYIHLFDIWHSGENVAVALCCFSSPEMGEEPFLYGYMLIHDPGEEYVEEVEYVVEEAAATEQLAEEAVEYVVAPQEITHFALNAPWGCDKEVFLEMYKGRTTPLVGYYLEGSTLAKLFPDEDGSDLVVTGYRLGDLDVALIVPDIMCEGGKLEIAHAVIVSDEWDAWGVETTAQLHKELSNDLGTPFWEGLQSTGIAGEGYQMRQDHLYSWLSERALVAFIATYATENPEEVFLYDLIILDAYTLQEEEEKAKEESSPEGVLNEALMDFDTPDQAHLKFRGISFNQDIYDFCAQLEQLGYIKDFEDAETGSVRIGLKGVYGGQKCIILLSSTPTTRKVFRLSVVFEETASWSELRKTYDSFKRRLTNKYGEPESIETFEEMYKEGSGLEMVGVETGHVTLFSEFINRELLGLGIVQLNITAADYKGFVYIDFYDSVNFILNEQEIEEQM